MTISGTHLKLAEIFGFIALAVLIVIGTFMREWVMSLIKKWNSSDRLNTREYYKYIAVRDQRINQILTELRVRATADRACVVMLHNGGKWFTEEPMKRLSCIYEICGDGISRERPNFQNVLVHEIPEALELLSGPGEVRDDGLPPYDCFKDVSRLQIDALSESYFKSLMMSQGVQVILSTPLEVKGTLVGFLILSYVQAGNANQFMNPGHEEVHSCEGKLELCECRRAFLSARSKLEGELNYHYHRSRAKKGELNV